MTGYPAVTELHDLSALEQAAGIRAGQLSPVELVEHYLDRIERLSGDLGAFVTVTAEVARTQAKQAEQAVRDGAVLPPLHGVPTAIKDLNATAGVRTTFGSAVLRDFVPTFDDNLVTLLAAAGTVSLGKTNTPEFGLPCYTEPDVAPPARTPWDLDRSAGGSSGGAGVAVAAGLVPFAQGSDGGGSIRIPASVCGLVGLKATRGRVSSGPFGSELTGLSTAGPLARTVADAAAMLDALAVPLPGDPYWAPPSPQPFLSYAGQTPGRLRIGRWCEPGVPGSDLHPHCRAAYEQASLLLAELGHEVEDIAAPFGGESLAPFAVLWEVSAATAPIDPALEPGLRPLTRYLRERGRATSATDFALAFGALRLTARQAIAGTAAYDAVLTPTLAHPPAPVGSLRNDDDPAADFLGQSRFTPYAAIYNVTGQPAVSLPLSWSSDGLPIGVMLAGRPAQEGLLISLAAQLEAARPWRDRQPACW